MKLLLLVLLVAAFGAAPAVRHEDKVWLMFFMKGENASPTDPAESKKLMDGHFANMKKQAALGRLLTAGPVQDPTKERRGITVLVGHERKDLDSYFTADPFVKAGIMKVDAAEWKVPSDKFDPTVDPSSIIEFRLVLFTRGRGMSPETKAMQVEHARVMKSFEKLGASVWGHVSGMQGIQQALIVEGKDEAKVRELLAEDPFVKKALLDVEILPLWMSKGTVKG